jgi:hypothetical protein
MSDQEVIGALDELERMIRESDLDLNGGEIASWRERFDAVVATAERGPGWDDIANRWRN